MKNIDTAFRYIRTVSLLVIAGSLIVSIVVIYKCFGFVSNTKEKIYVLANGKALEAYASERKDNIPVEAKDHVTMFHHYFFTLAPDENIIHENINKALYLADASAKHQYDNLQESNYYSNIIAGNVNQTIKVDSVAIDINSYPYHFRCFAQQELTRPTTVVKRRLITEGFLRNVSRSLNNSHGFLIEKWSIIENADVSTQTR